jgi:hypothetical protein
MMGKQQLCRLDRTAAERQTIGLFSYLQAENERLRLTALELSLEITALRQKLNMKRPAGTGVRSNDDS